MAITVKRDLFLYADDICLVFESKNVKDIEKQLRMILQTYVIGLLTIN